MFLDSVKYAFSLKWMYPSYLSRQETINRFLIFVVSVEFVLIVLLTMAFVVQRQEILDRRARADAHTQQWLQSMDAYNKSKGQINDKEGNGRNSKGELRKNLRHSK